MGRRPASKEPTRSALPAALRTVAIEERALGALFEALNDTSLGEAFEAAANLIVEAAGRIVVTGMGKSGLVGRKMAATLASTGTPSFFLHAAEAGHGDLGMIGRNDIVIAISWSGETSELSDVVSYSRRFKIPLVGITSRAQGSLAAQADVALILPQVVEACPNRLAPTSSTMLQAAIGDALAVALIELRGFSPEDFRVFHPRGRLGAQMLRVGDLMAEGEQVPMVPVDATILAAILEMSARRFGVTGVVGPERRLVGAFTDGDLRRAMAVSSADGRVRDHMTTSPTTVSPRVLASEALAIMNERNISQLFVTEDARVTGIIHLHDILRAGII